VNAAWAQEAKQVKPRRHEAIHEEERKTTELQAFLCARWSSRFSFVIRLFRGGRIVHSIALLRSD
jgi:hypothetical protein